MGISSNLGDFSKNLDKVMRDGVESALVEKLVKTARAEGLTSADQINLTLDADARKLGVDRARVLREVDRRIGGPSFPRSIADQ